MFWKTTSQEHSSGFRGSGGPWSPVPILHLLHMRICTKQGLCPPAPDIRSWLCILHLGPLSQSWIHYWNTPGCFVKSPQKWNTPWIPFMKPPRNECSLIYHKLSVWGALDIVKGRLAIWAFGQCPVGWDHWIKNGLLGWINNILRSNGPT